MAVNTNVLDFWNLLVNELIGDPFLFMIIALGVCALFLVKAKAPNEVLIITLFSVSAILSIYFGNLLLLIVVILGAGFTGWMMIRMTRS